MKKIIYFGAILFLLGFFLQSCSDYLDVSNPNIPEKDAYLSTQDAISGIAGVYDVVGWWSFQVDEWGIGDVGSDDAEKGGENNDDQRAMYDIKNFIATPENEIVRERWQEPFVGIGRANKLIANIDGNENVDAAVRTRIIAEAKFLRAFFYFQLVRDFGGVPLITKPLDPSDFTMPRNAIEECYVQIENDLLDAAAVLPLKSELSSDELGRATKGAANALLVKTYIYEEKWAEAEALALIIVNSHEYDLETSYEDVFKLSHDNGIESIFDYQFADLQAGAWSDAREGEVFTIFQRSREIDNGWGFVCPTQNLVDEYESGDQRLDATIIFDGDVLWEGTEDEIEIITNYDLNPTKMHNQKFQLPASQRGAEAEDPLNWRYIRFAEVLLWQAEAAAHNGSDWQTPLNKVRNRAGLLPTTQTDGLNAVYHERRVELALEGHRYYDLLRTGRGSLLSGYTENKRYLPIPQVEINLNPNLEQNPY